MADYAEGILLEPPRPLVWAWEMEQFHALLEPGALWDQPAGAVSKARHALIVYNIYHTFNTSDWSKWVKANPGAWKFKTEVDALRKTYHGR